MALDVKITTGLQSDKIDLSSNIVNLLSSGTVVNPAKTAPNTQAPYSGFDSDKIAIFSHFSIFKSLIK